MARQKVANAFRKGSRILPWNWGALIHPKAHAPKRTSRESTTGSEMITRSAPPLSEASVGSASAPAGLGVEREESSLESGESDAGSRKSNEDLLQELNVGLEDLMNGTFLTRPVMPTASDEPIPEEELENKLDETGVLDEGFAGSVRLSPGIAAELQADLGRLQLGSYPSFRKKPIDPETARKELEVIAGIRTPEKRSSVPLAASLGLNTSGIMVNMTDIPKPVPDSPKTLEKTLRKMSASLELLEEGIKKSEEKLAQGAPPLDAPLDARDFENVNQSFDGGNLQQPGGLALSEGSTGEGNMEEALAQLMAEAGEPLDLAGTDESPNQGLMVSSEAGDRSSTIIAFGQAWPALGLDKHSQTSPSETPPVKKPGNMGNRGGRRRLFAEEKRRSRPDLTAPNTLLDDITAQRVESVKWWFESKLNILLDISHFKAAFDRHQTPDGKAILGLLLEHPSVHANPALVKECLGDAIQRQDKALLGRLLEHKHFAQALAKEEPLRQQSTQRALDSDDREFFYLIVNKVGRISQDQVEAAVTKGWVGDVKPEPLHEVPEEKKPAPWSKGTAEKGREPAPRKKHHPGPKAEVPEMPEVRSPFRKQLKQCETVPGTEENVPKRVRFAESEEARKPSKNPTRHAAGEEKGRHSDRHKPREPHKKREAREQEKKEGREASKW